MSKRRWRGLSHVDPRLRDMVLERDGRRCRYCSREVEWTPRGGHLEEYHLTFDHVVPRYLGGPTTLANVVVSCYGCNQLKAGRSPADREMSLEKWKVALGGLK